MKKEMFSSEGKWYKGNLHAHTTNSDGRLTPAEMVEMYKSQGYQFMCLSEHDIYIDLRSEFDSEDFILLPGVETSIYCLEDRLKNIGDKKLLKKTHHIHGILGTEEMQRKAGNDVFQNGEKLTPPVFFGQWEGLKAAQDMVDYLKSKGCFTTYNHPVWSRVSMDEVTGLQGVWAMEIFNYGTEVECGEGYDKIFWDDMLRKGTHVNGFASDDNHNLEKLFDSFGGYVMVRSEELTHEAIVTHLLNGDYYFSGGPQIFRWGMEDDEIYVECSGVERIHFIAGGPIGCSETVLALDQKLTAARHKLTGNENYIRIECVDEKGRIAWTNPLWL